MASGNVLDTVMRDYGSFKGLAARAILNYIITELEELSEADKDGITNDVLKKALSLIDMEERDLIRLRTLIERLLDK